MQGGLGACNQRRARVVRRAAGWMGAARAGVCARTRLSEQLIHCACDVHARFGEGVPMCVFGGVAIDGGVQPGWPACMRADAACLADGPHDFKFLVIRGSPEVGGMVWVAIN